jgi:alcohol dehydrogenase
MTITCKATVLRTCGLPEPFAQSRPLAVEEVTIDPPQPTELLIRIGGAGLCHSDLSVINGTRPRPVPLAMGHEGAGEVMEVGSAVSGIRPGDHVVFQFSASCGRCRRCHEGRPQLCETAAPARAKGELMAGGRRIHDRDGVALAHHSGVSCFAEYAVVDRGSVVPIDKEVPLREAALFGCAVMTGVGAVINTARIRPGDTVAILALGGVGLSGLIGAALAGAGKVIALDLDPAKLKRALALGATHGFDPAAPGTVEEIRALTGGGVDFAIELAGAVAAMRTAYAITRRGGEVITAGLSPAGAEFAFEHASLVSDEKSIRGSYMGSCAPARDIPRFLDFYRQGRLPVDRLIDGFIGFDDINQGFDRLSTGGALRQVLVPHG